jgi:hypothetical protein
LIRGKTKQAGNSSRAFRSTSPQELARDFALIFKDINIVLVLPELPAGHIWCGIPNVNERIDFVVLWRLNNGDSLSHRLTCDMKSVWKINRWF